MCLISLAMRTTQMYSSQYLILPSSRMAAVGNSHATLTSLSGGADVASISAMADWIYVTNFCGSTGIADRGLDQSKHASPVTCVVVIQHLQVHDCRGVALV